MTKYRVPVIIEKDDDGFFAYCPTLQGCYTQGDTFEEVLKNTKDIIRLHIIERIEKNEEIPQPEIINLSLIEVSI